MTLGGKLTILFGVLFFCLGLAEIAIPDEFESLHFELNFTLQVMMLPLGLLGHVLTGHFTLSREIILIGTLCSMIPNFFLWGYTMSVIIDAVVVPEDMAPGNLEPFASPEPQPRASSSEEYD